MGDAVIDTRDLSKHYGRVRALDRAVTERTSHLFTLLGSAGVGKSRLTHEFLTERATEECQIVEGGALEIDRDVALKVMVSNIADDPELNERFKREARAVGRIIEA